MQDVCAAAGALHKIGDHIDGTSTTFGWTGFLETSVAAADMSAMCRQLMRVFGMDDQLSAETGDFAHRQFQLVVAERSVFADAA